MRIEISKHIIADTEICHGKPTFKGTRVLVSDIVELIAVGENTKSIIKGYPSVTEKMVREALEYSAKLIRGGRYARFSKIPA